MGVLRHAMIHVVQPAEDRRRDDRARFSAANAARPTEKALREAQTAWMMSTFAPPLLSKRLDHTADEISRQ